MVVCCSWPWYKGFVLGQNWQNQNGQSFTDGECDPLRQPLETCTENSRSEGTELSGEVLFAKASLVITDR